MKHGRKTCTICLSRNCVYVILVQEYSCNRTHFVEFNSKSSSMNASFAVLEVAKLFRYGSQRFQLRVFIHNLSSWTHVACQQSYMAEGWRLDQTNNIGLVSQWSINWVTFEWTLNWASDIGLVSQYSIFYWWQLTRHCLYLFVSVCLFVSVYVSVSLCLSLSVCLFVSVYVSVSLCLCTC